MSAQALPVNLVVLQGVIARPPTTRHSRGEEVVDFDLATADGWLPVVAPSGSSPASVGLVEGESVVVLGVLRRRFFRAGAATVGRVEVLAVMVTAARRRATVAKVLERMLSP